MVQAAGAGGALDEGKMIYRYNVTITKENDIYMVEFPQFGIKGRGMPEYEDTLEFAKDYLAEIILTYLDKSKVLPRMPEGSSHERISGEPVESDPIIEVNVDQYQERIKADAKRVFYEFETDADVLERNKPAFGGMGKKLAIGAAAVCLIVIVIIFIHSI